MFMQLIPTFGTIVAFGMLAATTVTPAIAMAADTPPSLVEDYAYPGAAAIEEMYGIKLIKGDGRITLADCDGNPDLIKVETLTNDVCFVVKGDTGWLSLRIDNVFLVGAGDQDLAVKVEGVAANIEVPSGTSRPIRSVDPTRRGTVVEIRAHTAGPKPIISVIPLGDSITVGVGSTTNAGYRLPLWNSMMTRHTEFDIEYVGSQSSGNIPDMDHEGHSGWLIDNIRYGTRTGEGIDNWLPKYRPDLIILHIGINDLNRNFDVAQAAQSLAALVDRVFELRPDVTLILGGLIATTQGQASTVPVFNQRAKELEQQELRSGRKMHYVDLPIPRQNLPDGLHPDDIGYSQIAGIYQSAIEKAIADGWVTPHKPNGTGRRQRADNFIK